MMTNTISPPNQSQVLDALLQATGKQLRPGGYWENSPPKNRKKAMENWFPAESKTPEQVSEGVEILVLSPANSAHTWGLRVILPKKEVDSKIATPFKREGGWTPVKMWYELEPDLRVTPRDEVTVQAVAPDGTVLETISARPWHHLEGRIPPNSFDGALNPPATRTPTEKALATIATALRARLMCFKPRTFCNTNGYPEEIPSIQRTYALWSSVTSDQNNPNFPQPHVLFERKAATMPSGAITTKTRVLTLKKTFS